MGGCFGSCLGSCLAADCIFLATLGNTTSRKAVRCTLIWLQAFAALLSTLVALYPVAIAWEPLAWTCVAFVSGSLTDDVSGICACGRDASCLSDQLVFRVQASAFLVFVLLLCMALSGCGRHAAHRYPVMKFMAIVVLAGISVFIPFSRLGAFDNVASIISAGFLVVQALLLVDIAWQVNDHWAQQMNESQRAPRGGNGWRAALILTSLAFFVGAFVGTWAVHQVFNDSAATWLVFSSLLVSVALLLLSITEWCKQGNLLTSCVFCSYSMWLCWLALQARPGSADAVATDESGSRYTEALAMMIAALCLGSMATNSANADGTNSEPMLPEALVQDSAGGSDTSIIVVRPFTTEQKNDFIKQCAIHALGTLYVASIMAPQITWLNFYVRVVAVLLSLMVYGWTLAAPQVLSDRF